MTDLPPADECTDAGAIEHRRALSALYRRHWSELVRFVQSNFGSGPPEPEEIVQTAFAQYAALSDPAAVANPRAFLFQTVRNEALQQRRKLEVRKKFAASVDSERILDRSNEIHAERILRGKQRLRIVSAAIERMEARQREFLLLNRLHSLSFAEIARRKRAPESTVRKLVLQAMLACEEALHGADGD